MAHPSSASRRAASTGRIRDRRTFGALRRDGRRFRSGPIVITALVEPDAAAARVAYAISKQTGSAVARNRVRRRLRAIVRTLELRPGAYLVRVAPAAAEMPYRELEHHLTAATAEVVQ